MSESDPKQQLPVSSPEDTGEASPPLETSQATGHLLPGSHWTDVPLEPEAEDPTLSDNRSSTASISSSILKYRTIQGRTYHSERGNAEYWGSNDERQNEAMDIAHHLHTLTLDGELFLAPIKDDIQKAVDICTGTGLWAIDFGDAFPSCEVIGTDVSPIQPTWVPPNVKFQIDDCEQSWTFADNSIDFVHMRYLLGSIQNWSNLLEQAFRCTKPGGYVESFEGAPRFESDDGTVKEDSALAQWGKLFVEGGRAIGRSFKVVDDGTQRASIEKAGFVDVQETDFKVPIGKWPRDPKMKETGEFGYAAVATDVEGYVTYMASMQGWTKEEVMVYAAHLRREMRNPAIHGYYRVKVVWGKKPEAK